VPSRCIFKVCCYLRYTCVDRHEFVDRTAPSRCGQKDFVFVTSLDANDLAMAMKGSYSLKARIMSCLCSCAGRTSECTDQLSPGVSVRASRV